MASVTFATLRQYLGQQTGFFYSGVNTGTASNAVTDANIARWDVNRLKNIWTLIKSGNRAGQSRRIASVSSTTATFVSALSGALANADTFDFLPYDPDLMAAALQDATHTVWPKTTRRGFRGLYVPTTDETLIVDNLLLNSSFETFATTFTSWDNIGTPTLAQSSRNKHRSYSAQIGATGAVEGIEQNILTSLNQMDITNKVLHVRGWTWDDAESSTRLRVTFDGSTFTNGAYNTGDGEWKGFAYNAIDAAIPDDLTEATISCEVASGETGLFDLVVAWVDPIWDYTMPTAFYPDGPARVSVQVNADRPKGDYGRVDGCYPKAGMVLRLEGAGRLTVGSADADTTEIDNAEAEFLVAEAAAIMYGRLANEEPAKRAEHLLDAQRWQAISDIRRESMKLLPSANNHVGWSISTENARQLRLDR